MTGRRVALRTRSMLAFGLLATVVSSLVAAVSYELTRSTLISQRERGAERQAFLNARTVSAGITGDPDDPGEALGRVQTSSGGAALLRVGGDWFSNSVTAGRSDVPPSLLLLTDEGSAARQRVAGADGVVVAVGVPLPRADATYVELVPFEEVTVTLDRVARGLMVAVVAAALAGTIAGRSLTSRVLRPVRRTAKAANEIREGALDRRLESEDDADLEPLVQAFNEMVDSLQARIEREARFASDVSHELRSPLATIDAALSVARRRVNDPSASAALESLAGEVARFRELVVDLLEIARAQAGVAELDWDEVDPVALASSVLEASHRESVELVVQPSVTGLVRIDKRRIGQALINLLDNADNYGGGATCLRVSGDGDTIRFAVEDHGPGVPDHEKEYVFQRFARGADVSVPGTGLGLALVSEHVRLHGGTVTIEDCPDGGARFVIELPRGIS